MRRRHTPRPQQVVGLALQEEAGVGQRQQIAADRFFGRFAEFAPRRLAKGVALVGDQPAQRPHRPQTLPHRQALSGGLGGADALDLFGDGREGGEFHAGYHNLKEPKTVGERNASPVPATSFIEFPLEGE